MRMFAESAMEQGQCLTKINGWHHLKKSDFYYANWAKGREKGEVDLVWIDNGTQKAFSVAEIKWTDRFAENPTELKSLFHFVNENKGLLVYLCHAHAPVDVALRG